MKPSNTDEKSSVSERILSGGPIYNLDDVQGLARKEGSISLATRKCRKNVQDLLWSIDDVADLILDLTSEHYRNSEICKTEITSYESDAYVIRRREFNKYANKNLDTKYYIKFAVGPTNKVIIIISCHT